MANAEGAGEAAHDPYVSNASRARESYFARFGPEMRKHLTRAKLMVTGGFRTRAAMEEAVNSGECDVIGLGRPTATTPDAADALLSGRAEAVTAHQIRYGMRGLLGKFVELKTLDGLLELGWHADQLHRIGDGLEPDLDRSRLAATAAMLRRSGRISIGSKRGF